MPCGLIMRITINTARAPTFFNSDGMNSVESWIMVPTMMEPTIAPIAVPSPPSVTPAKMSSSSPNPEIQLTPLERL